MEKFIYTKKAIYDEKNYFKVMFIGYALEQDVNIEKKYDLMDKFISKRKPSIDMAENIAYIRTILRDLKEEYLKVVYIDQNKKEKVVYKKEKIYLYKKSDFRFNEMNLKVKAKLNKEDELILSFKSEDKKILEYGELIRENSSLIYDIAKLKDIKAIELDINSKFLVKFYNAFFNMPPDFTDDIEIRVQSMMSILIVFLITLYDLDYSFTPITDKKIPISLDIYSLLSKLYPFGKIDNIDVNISDEVIDEVKTVGKYVRNFIGDEKKLDDELINISKIVYYARYNFGAYPNIEEISRLSNCSEEKVKKVIKLFNFIKEKL